MINSPQSSVPKPRFRRAVALTLAYALALGTTGFAQTTELLPSPSKVRDALARPIPRLAFDAPDVDLRQPVVEQNGIVQRPAPGAARSQQRLRSPASGNRGSRARRAAGAAIGAIGGFFLGGALGAALEGDSCNCDDPGLMGFLVGAPVGAAIGGVVGALLGGN